eukprot:TRINITY_DN63905_c0_g1_i1.p1 TRINITY_DN63905_c0_g1~~TRINITY_DN63905_c0_g1_i1.p1  ORF type:complete len:252 (-),score=47.59 TRINITY_DN63905_c0_g1_i1:93-848(-)
MIPTVPHRMTGIHARKDPLMQEEVGSGKRRKIADGSDVAYYKETTKERKDRISRSKRSGCDSYALPNEADTAAGERVRLGPSVPHDRPNALSKLSDFKDRLKSSKLPADAEDAERKHKADLEAEEAKALSKRARPPSSSDTKQACRRGDVGENPSSVAKPAAEGGDEKVTFSQIWQEGEEESTADWLTGGGLKFHTTADKAFAMDSKRFKETLDTSDKRDNREALAEDARRRGEMKMADFRHSQAGKGDRR